MKEWKIGDEQDVLLVLREVGAVITNSHIVYTSGKHGSAYIYIFCDRKSCI